LPEEEDGVPSRGVTVIIPGGWIEMELSLLFPAELELVHGCGPGELSGVDKICDWIAEVNIDCDGVKRVAEARSL
jgi:hypothetical protein